MSLVTITNAHTSEERIIRYLPGRPKQYRFNGQTGRFNINGTKDVGTSLTVQPIAWHIFEENLFARGRKEVWAELFFVDETDAVSSIMFNNSSVNELYSLIEPLFYDDLTLADVVLTITAEKKQNTKVTPIGTYYIAQFEYKPAGPGTKAMFEELAQQAPLFRADTLTPTAVTSLVSDFFAYGIETHAQPAQLEAAKQEANN